MHCGGSFTIGDEHTRLIPRPEPPSFWFAINILVLINSGGHIRIVCAQPAARSARPLATHSGQGGTEVPALPRSVVGARPRRSAPPRGYTGDPVGQHPDPRLAARYRSRGAVTAVCPFSGRSTRHLTRQAAPSPPGRCLAASPPWADPRESRPRSVPAAALRRAVVTGGGSGAGRCAARTRIVLRAATGMATDPRPRSPQRRNRSWSCPLVSFVPPADASPGGRGGR